MEYKILISRKSITLEKEVAEHLADGWSLAGGVAITQSESQTKWFMVYAQAVTRPLESQE